MSSRPLAAIQTCFVVPDVEAAVRDCEQRFGWGPFARFSAEREHGLVRAGTASGGGAADGPGVGRWLSGGRAFRFLDTPFGAGALRAALD